MSKIVGTTFFIFFSISIGLSQEQDPYDKKYEWRIRQKVLYGVYIPKDVNEAIVQLNRLTDAESKSKFKSMTEVEVVNKLFFSFGRWMTHNWGFYNGSRLSVYFGNMGVHHPEDMVRFMMIVFHRSLNKKPLEIKELLKSIQEKEKLDKEKRKEKGTIIYEEKRLRAKPVDEKNGNN